MQEQPEKTLLSASAWQAKLLNLILFGAGEQSNIPQGSTWHGGPLFGCSGGLAHFSAAYPHTAVITGSTPAHR